MKMFALFVVPKIGQIRTTTGTRTSTTTIAVAVAAAFLIGTTPVPATAAGTYTAYVTYASTPSETLGKTATGWKALTPAEVALVPADAITHRSTQFLRVEADGQLFKVTGETVTALTELHWSYEGSPTPRNVDRQPALEYYTYASAPQELLVRAPLGTWRHATDAEYAAVDTLTITRRVNTYFLRDVGSSQVVKQVNGMATPISDAQWRGEGSPTPMVPESADLGSNPFTTSTPYVDPAHPSVAAATRLRLGGDLVGAAEIDKISRYAGTKWVGDWTPLTKTETTVSQYAQRALDAGQTGVLVIYGIPGRDCTGHSAGGLSAEAYYEWIRAIAAGIAGKRLAVVLEPDALLQLGRCPDLQGDRLGLLNYAAKNMAASGATVYIDAGTSNSVPPSEMASRLVGAGVEEVRGFAVNVSNYKHTAEERAYADELSRLLGGKNYVIDTSRNGNGANGEWCNPRGRALGEVPGVANHGNQDASLWIKTVGTSDGLCNGGPAAGTWWDEIAIELASNSIL
ncbi:glycoside hydrolase family 6 protein [Salinibacterium sp. ZJ450]|uniref:glycoside hydrolase family 6 protein n=1 Tax=Salinibacterium sp. ZJ450 TaxID=2708338 RepID=UPI00141ED329|nr:glycoside hydrolase family 6 protein [Salinibacterium sp. ZJ450]